MSEFRESLVSAPQRLPRVVTVTGGWKAPSKTRVLADAIIASLERQRPIHFTRVDLAEVGQLIAGVTTRERLSADTAALFGAVEAADLLIVGSPIFKASYTGLFKHFFDLFDPTSLSGKAVLLMATGGSERHALALEHHFRPLFSFFTARTLATTVYAVESDFQGRQVASDLLEERIARAVTECVRELDRLRPSAPSIPLRVVDSRPESSPPHQLRGATT